MKRTFEEAAPYVFVSLGVEKSEMSIEKGSYELLYSNLNDDESLKTDGTLNLEPGEILIIKKAD